MAPTINDSSDRRRPFTLEEYLQTTLRLKDGVRGTSRVTLHISKFTLNQSKARSAMGLIFDEGRREGDSPSLPPASSTFQDFSPDPYNDNRKQELIELSIKTAALLRRNQQLQKRLTALQKETRALVKSALEGSDDAELQAGLQAIR